MKQKTQTTRRGFIQLSSGAFLGGGVLNPSAKSAFATVTPTNSDPVEPPGKVALEKHFDFVGTEKSSYASVGGQEFQGKIKDLGRVASRVV